MVRNLRFLLLAVGMLSACESDADDDGMTGPDASLASDAGIDARAPDAAVDASTIDGSLDGALSDAGARGDAGALWSCYVFGSQNILHARLYGADAGREAFLACTTSADCVAIPDDFECENRDVRFRGCGAYVAQSRVADYQRWFDGKEAELCPRVEAPCNASPQCTATTAACVEGRCTGVPRTDAGAQ